MWKNILQFKQCHSCQISCPLVRVNFLNFPFYSASGINNLFLVLFEKMVLNCRVVKKKSLIMCLVIWNIWEIDCIFLANFLFYFMLEKWNASCKKLYWKKNEIFVSGLFCIVYSCCHLFSILQVFFFWRCFASSSFHFIKWHGLIILVFVN